MEATNLVLYLSFNLTQKALVLIVFPYSTKAICILYKRPDTRRPTRLYSIVDYTMNTAFRRDLYGHCAALIAANGAKCDGIVPFEREV